MAGENYGAEETQVTQAPENGNQQAQEDVQVEGMGCQSAIKGATVASPNSRHRWLRPSRPPRLLRPFGVKLPSSRRRARSSASSSSFDSRAFAT